MSGTYLPGDTRQRIQDNAANIQKRYSGILLETDDLVQKARLSKPFSAARFRQDV
jgi:hypothetical protein